MKTLNLGGYIFYISDNLTNHNTEIMYQLH